MAEHADVTYGVAAGNDLPAHEAGYERFVHLVFIGCAHVASIVLALCIGAVQGHWLAAFLLIVVATVIAVHGFLTGARGPSAAMVLVSLLSLAAGAA